VATERTLAQDTGARAETAARAFLESHGLHFVAANAASRPGELDLVMRDGEVLVFVEVRYRASDRYGGALASVDRAKQRRLVRAAEAFLARHRAFQALCCRFDVVAAQGDPDAPRMHWVRDAFRADDDARGW
jgi:putative endonuclease